MSYDLLIQRLVTINCTNPSGFEIMETAVAVHGVYIYQLKPYSRACFSLQVFNITASIQLLNAVFQMFQVLS